MQSKLQSDLAEFQHRHKRRVERIRSLPNMDEETIQYLLAQEREAYRQGLQDCISAGYLPRYYEGIDTFLLVLGVLLLVLAFVFVFALPANTAAVASLGFAVAGGLAFVAAAIIYVGNRIGERKQTGMSPARPPEPPGPLRSEQRNTP